MADVVHAELGESGLAWVRESLSAGRALSAAVLERAAGEAAKSVWAYVPASANLEANGTLFRFGGLFTANIARGAWFGTFTRLCLHRGTIIVEDELALPSDESLRGSVGTFAVVDSTVLYPKVLAPETTADEIRKFILGHSSGYPLNSFWIRGVEFVTPEALSEPRVHKLAERVDAVIVSGWDNESLLVLEFDPSW
jgi:hypothetical protein